MGQDTKEKLYIESQQSLDELAQRMDGVCRVAIDTEADSLYHYFEKVCLIQLAVGEDLYLVDPLSGMDLTAFLNVLSKKQLVLHGGDYDLRMMRLTFGFRPEVGVFDTMSAAKLLGNRRLGLSSLVEETFQVKLTDDGKKSDWSRRPLTEKQIEYALNDVRYLQQLADYLQNRLIEAGREQWHAEICDRLVSASDNIRESDPDEAWRIKGCGALEPKQLAYLQALWNWRDQQAQQVDLPPFKVLGNAQLLDIAVWAADNPQGTVEQQFRLPRNCKGRRLSALKKALRSVLDLRPSDYPRQRRSKNGKPPKYDRSKEIQALMEECSRIAERIGIEAPALAPRSAVEAIIHSNPRSIEEIIEGGSLMRWQAELLWEGVQAVRAKRS